MRSLRRAERLLAARARDGGTCLWCGRAFDSLVTPTTEHVVPRVKGGPSWLENEVAACARCNGQRGHRGAVEWLAECERRGWSPDVERLRRVLEQLAAAIEERGGQRRARPYVAGQLRRLRRTLAAVALLVLVLAGCSGGADDPVSTRSAGGGDVGTSSSARSTAPAAPTPTGSSGIRVPIPTVSIPVPTGAAVPGPVPTTTETGLVGVISPSGNIGCLLGEGYARCDIAERDWSPPPAPDCDLDFGNAVDVGPSGAGLVCAGDTVLGATQVLAYGTAVRSGDAVCTSAESGMTCRLDDGRGFELSRAAYRLF